MMERMTEETPNDPYAARAPIDDLAPPAPAGEPALQRLGPAPFPKSGFPFLGFLASIYEHLAAHLRADRQRHKEL